MSIHNESVREKALESLIQKRLKHPEDDIFYESLDKVERVLLTDIHFGLFKVSDENKKLLEMK